MLGLPRPRGLPHLHTCLPGCVEAHEWWGSQGSGSAGTRGIGAGRLFPAPPHPKDAPARWCLSELDGSTGQQGSRPPLRGREPGRPVVLFSLAATSPITHSFAALERLR